jgi:mRNA-degrading endonuclease toxin of MazEF toxin-antitoxin module
MHKPGQIVWVNDVGTDHKRKTRPGIVVEVNGSYVTVVPCTTRYPRDPSHVDLEVFGRGTIASCEHLTSRHISEVSGPQGRIPNDKLRAIEHAIGYHLSEVRGSTRPRHSQHSEWMLDGEVVRIVSNDKANAGLHHVTVVPCDRGELRWQHVSTVDKSKLRKK